MTVVFAFLLMLIIVAAMAIGVIMGRKPIAGSCGGISALGLGGPCEICGGNPDACDGDRRPGRLTSAAAALGSDASGTRGNDRRL
ncbi:MAG: (Na+)-NQR maturation NqrM [Pseudomonadales bacterium]